MSLFQSAAFQIGFEKAANNAYDNQPGPHPGTPASPDSHLKRNIAVGAGLLAAGALGTKKLYSAAGNMAMSRRQAMAKSIGNAARGAAGNAEQTAHVRGVAKKFQELKKKPVTLGERGRALFHKADDNISERMGFKGPYEHLRGKGRTGSGGAREAMAQSLPGAKPAPGSRTAKRLGNDTSLRNYMGGGEPSKNSLRFAAAKRRAKIMGYGALATGGAAVAGGAAASRAKEEESSQTPGV